MRLRWASPFAGALFLTLVSAGFVAAQCSPQPVTPPSEHADRQDAGIAVMVVDPQGAVIMNSCIQLMKGADKVLARGVMDETGQFRLIGLPAGSYVVEVSAQGFKTQRQNVGIQARTVTNVMVRLDVNEAACCWGPVAIPPEVETEGSTAVDLTPCTPLPPHRNFFKRFFAGLFHKLGF